MARSFQGLVAAAALPLAGLMAYEASASCPANCAWGCLAWTNWIRTSANDTWVGTATIFHGTSVACDASDCACIQHPTGNRKILQTVVSYDNYDTWDLDCSDTGILTTGAIYGKWLGGGSDSENTSCDSNGSSSSNSMCD